MFLDRPLAIYRNKKEHEIVVKCIAQVTLNLALVALKRVSL